MDDRDGQVEPAFHAAGERAGAIVGCVPAGRPRRAVRRRDSPSSVPAQAVELAEEAQVLAGGQFGVDGEVLRADADEAAELAVAAVERFAEEPDLAGVGGGQTAQMDMSVVLPAPLGPRARNLAFVDGQRDAVECDGFAESLMQVGDFEYGRHRVMISTLDDLFVPIGSKQRHAAASSIRFNQEDVKEIAAAGAYAIRRAGHVEPPDAIGLLVGQPYRFIVVLFQLADPFRSVSS